MKDRVWREVFGALSLLSSLTVFFCQVTSHWESLVVAGNSVQQADTQHNSPCGACHASQTVVRSRVLAASLALPVRTYVAIVCSECWADGGKLLT